MTDHRDVDLRQWIQAAAAATRPIGLEDVLNRSAPGTDRTDVTTSEPPIVIDPAEEDPVTKRRNLYLALAAAIAFLALGAYAVTNADNNTSAATRDDTTTTTAAVETTTTSTSTTIPLSRAELATELWQALVAGDREQALSLVDPIELDSPAVPPFGRARTLDGQFDWYEAVGWEWQLSSCGPDASDVPICTVSASNSWTEALGVEPVTGSFRVVFSDDGIIRVTDENGSFSNQWGRQAFEPFSTWVRENHPDDAAVMFGDTDVTPEILDLFELNTARFVESRQDQ